MDISLLLSIRKIASHFLSHYLVGPCQKAGYQASHWELDEDWMRVGALEMRGSTLTHSKYGGVGATVVGDLEKVDGIRELEGEELKFKEECRRRELKRRWRGSTMFFWGLSLIIAGQQAPIVAEASACRTETCGTLGTAEGQMGAGASNTNNLIGGYDRSMNILSLLAVNKWTMVLPLQCVQIWLYFLTQ